MREHAEYYKQFIDVHPGGGIRRNPKRKNAGAYSSPANYTPPSAQDIDRVFESHLLNMARGGTYGDNMEIVAFSSAYETDVKIYQRDFAYLVSANADASGRPIAHIAYHLWEHYSSIRNLNGPHSGLPTVAPKALSVEEERKQKEILEKTPYVQAWMVDVVSASLTFLTDKTTIRQALEAAKGNVDVAVSNLMDAEEAGSASSQPESSSVERDHDSDDDMHDGPNKKRDRRLSRATKAQTSRSTASKLALSHLATHDGSQESVNSFDSDASSEIGVAHPNGSSGVTAPDQLHDRLQSEDSTSASRSQSPLKPTVRLKLHPPKPPSPAPQRLGKTQQRQPGPRITARDRKEMKKQQQKANRKERQLNSLNGGARSQSPSAAGLALRQKGMTETPPVETLRTLYI